jgi:hypothetical protein
MAAEFPISAATPQRIAWHRDRSVNKQRKPNPDDFMIDNPFRAMLRSFAYSQSFGAAVLIKRYNIYGFVNTSIIGAQALRPEQKNKTCAQEMIDWWVMADRKLTGWFVSVNPA